jgi:protein gp37
MGATTNIEWSTSTFNPWIGCQHVSPGCDHCYAEADWDKRKHRVKWGPHGERSRTSEAYWRQPLTWNRNGEDFEREHGHRQRIFCASLADVFDNKVPKQWRSDLWRLVRQTPRLDWMLLTKRPQNIGKMLPADWGDGWPQVWLGVTCESQQYFDQRWPLLAAIPAAVRFISYEPALGPLTLRIGPDWLICGGESGANARLMEPAWARQVRDQCATLGIAFFMKQMTKKQPIPRDLLVRQFPGATMILEE